MGCIESKSLQIIIPKRAVVGSKQQIILVGTEAKASMSYRPSIEAIPKGVLTDAQPDCSASSEHCHLTEAL